MSEQKETQANNISTQPAEGTVSVKPQSNSLSGSHGSGPLTRQGQHPLQTKWQFWYVQRQQTIFNPVQTSEGGEDVIPLKKKKFDSYRESLKDLGLISTVEQFFQYFVYMKKPSEMPREIDLFFFREGEVPMWEESPNGGIWIIKIKKEDNVNKMWESLLLSLISINSIIILTAFQVSNLKSLESSGWLCRLGLKNDSWKSG